MYGDQRSLLRLFPSGLALHDKNGTPRATLRVSAEGVSLKLHDEDGEVLTELPQDLHGVR